MQQLPGHQQAQFPNLQNGQNDSLEYSKQNPIQHQWNIDNSLLTGQSISGITQLLTEVNFNVKCGQTQVGDRVAMLGNIEDLGQWKIDQAVFLETSSDIFPTWSIKLQLPRNQIIEYKYLIIRFGKKKIESNPQSYIMSQSLGNQKNVQNYGETLPIIGIEWESLGNPTTNRRLNTYNKKEINLQDEMNNKLVIEEYVEEKSAFNIDQVKAID